MRIFLVGYMGCGKSTLGKQLAKKLSVSFQDLDKYIEQINNCSVSDFFNRYGERIFRKEERHRLTELCLNKDIVIAVGGGTPCFKNNIELMNHYGTTIFIDAPIDFLYKRLKYRTETRPLLANKTETELLDFIKKTHKERLHYYRKAKYTIQAENLRVEDLLPFFN